MVDVNGGKASSGTLITVAPTGAEADAASNAGLPVTPESLAEATRLCGDAGASVVHIHVRDEFGKPTLALPRVREACEAVRSASDLIIQVSTGGAVSDTEHDRIVVLDAAPEMASLTCGTVNFGNEVFVNRWPFMVELYRRMTERSIVPEFEIFDLGHVENLLRLLDTEGPPVGGHVHADLVMGVPGGMAGTTATLVDVVQRLPTGSSFSVTGIGRASVPMMLASLSTGGHLRVGMEDTLTFSQGQPVRDNSQLVERAAECCHLAGRPPLTRAQAREFLGISGTGRV